MTCMERGIEDYKRACLALCHSINPATDTCFTCGADAVYYLDGHGGGGNVDESLIDPRAVKCDIANMCDKSFDKGDPTVERVDARTLRRRVARILRYEDLKF